MVTIGQIAQKDCKSNCNEFQDHEGVFCECPYKICVELLCVVDRRNWLGSRNGNSLKYESIGMKCLGTFIYLLFWFGWVGKWTYCKTYCCELMDCQLDDLIICKHP